jgi:ribonuclease HI
LIAVLEHLLDLGAQREPIMVYGDSRLVIQQMFGRWNIKSGVYVPYALKAKELRQSFSNLSGQWIKREKNTVADELSKRPLRTAGIEFRLQPEEPWISREQHTMAHALSKAHVPKAGAFPSLSLGDDEEEAYYDRNYGAF